MNEQDIFLQTLKQPDADKRLAYVAQACEGQPALRRRVEVLLSAHERSGPFLESPAAGSVATLDQAPPVEQPGTVIGPYKLLQEIGEGGMGVVYMAEQERPVRRRVALKIIKPGMDSRQVIARFEAERQALAMMDHQNIAKVHDAGTTESGRPYFVMELVHGVPLTKFCDDNRLSVRQRLELFIPVCHAIQHAHQKGIIHRDIKPSNVLVTMYDDKPVPKVIDFGVAKAVEQRLTDKTLFTHYGTLVGTFEYMSPEQAEMNAFGVDTRSDIYSLGVLLYELLTGQTPFDRETLAKAGVDEIRRIIREEEPETVSARIVRTRRVGYAHRASSDGHSPPYAPRPEPHIPRISELDWIVMKALEKDRTRRYESASALAADIQRYLSDEPVLACPPTTMYRFQKFARKHKPALATAAVIAASLLLGTTVSAWQAVRATTAEAQANANEAKAQSSAQKAEEKAREAQTQAQEAATQRDEAQRQRDEVQRQRDEIKGLSERLLASQQDLLRTLYAAHINLAKQAWDEANVPRVLNLLNQHRSKPGEPDLRGFEWHLLDRLCRGDAPLALKAESLFGIVGSVAFSPDGKRLLTVAARFATRPGATERPEPELKVWDVLTGQELQSFTLKGGGQTAVFSPDARRLASGSGSDQAVKVWDAETGQELLSLQVGGVGGYGRGSILFSPDGKRIFCRGEGGQVKVWDAQTGQELPPFNGATVPVAFSPDGKRLAAFGGTWDDTEKGIVGWKLKVWDAQTGQELTSLTGARGQVAFSADGKRLISVGSEWDQEQKKLLPGGIKVWDAQTGEELVSVKAPSEGFEKVVFSPDGKRLAIASGDTTTPVIKVWNAQTALVDFTFQGHTAGVHRLAFSPDGQRLASSSHDRTLRIWDLESGKEVRTLRGLPSIPAVNGSLLFSPDGARLASADGPEVKVWDAQKNQENRQTITLKGVNRTTSHGPGDTPAVFSPDFRRLAGIAFTKVKIFDATSGQEKLTLQAHANRIFCVAYSPDGKLLASGDGDRTKFVLALEVKTTPGVVKVWDAASGGELFTLPGHDHAVLQVAFSPDSKRLASVSEDRTVKVWDMQTGRELLSISPKKEGPWYAPGIAVIAGLAFSPDGKRLAANGKLLDAETGNEVLSVGGFSGGIAFSPDGRRLVSTGGGPGGLAVRMFDAETGKQLFALSDDGGNVAFSPDGKRLASAARIWDAQTGEELMSLKRLSGISGRVAFSPDGHRLGVVSPFVGEVTIYDATPLPNP